VGRDNAEIAGEKEMVMCDLRNQVEARVGQRVLRLDRAVCVRARAWQVEAWAAAWSSACGQACLEAGARRAWELGRADRGSRGLAIGGGQAVAAREAGGGRGVWWWWAWARPGGGWWRGGAAWGGPGRASVEGGLAIEQRAEAGGVRWLGAMRPETTRMEELTGENDPAEVPATPTGSTGNTRIFRSEICV
jgi:hypothetical protein